jgi:predicted transcriptional regulator
MIRLPKPKRSKMEIYNDVLSAIKVELTNGEAKPTRVQSLSNLAYDKLVRYLSELESKEMIVQNPLNITEKGYDFLQDYDRIRDFISVMNIKYFNFLRREIYEH